MLKVKFNTRKVNSAFADADEVRYIVSKEPKLSNCDPAVVAELVEKRFAKVANRGPGWGLELFIDHSAMEAAGFIKEWSV